MKVKGPLMGTKVPRARPFPPASRMLEIDPGALRDAAARRSAGDVPVDPWHLQRVPRLSYALVT